MGQNLSGAENCRRTRYLFVRAMGGTYAIPSSRVERVLSSARVFPVPGANDAFLGLLQHEGEPVILLDLATLVGAGEGVGSDPPFTVIVKAGTDQKFERVALGVQEALTVDWISEENLNAVNQGLVCAETVVDSQVVRLVDLCSIGKEA